MLATVENDDLDGDPKQLLFDKIKMRMANIDFLEINAILGNIMLLAVTIRCPRDYCEIYSIVSYS